MRLIGDAKKVFFYSLPYILSLTAAGLLFGAVAAYAVNSPAFQLEEVRILNIGTISQAEAFAFCGLNRGENLVGLDLGSVQQVIKRTHPEFKEVRVRRVLPSRIEIVLKRRTPIAQVALSRFVQIDKDFVILPGSSPTPFRNLVIIEGSTSPRDGALIGQRLADPAMQKAIRLAEAVRRSNVLGRHQLTKVNISDPRNIAFFVDGDIEIRIGGNHFLERLKILDQTLKSVELDASKVRYIDLRFDDVVIGPR